MKFFKFAPVILLAGLMSGCFGYTATDNEATGQVKRVVHNTPLICPNYYTVDISLGVMVNGTGSVSKQDVWFFVDDSSVIKKLQEASKSGKIVNVKYDIERTVFCVDSDHILTDVTIQE